MSAEPTAPTVHSPSGELTPLVANGVSFARASRRILDNVSLIARPGQATAIVGPSGSGKSSLVAILAGLESPDSGTVERPTGQAALILQAYGLVSLLTATENVELPLQSRDRAEVSRADIQHAAARAIELAGLTPVAHHLVEELSGGQQQRVALARALAVQPQIIFADEFTSELDQATKAYVVDLVLGIARAGGIVVISTHDLDIAARCDQVVSLRDGRVVSPGHPQP
jgi:putative ABC transport system ATP-binding protein